MLTKDVDVVYEEGIALGVQGADAPLERPESFAPAIVACIIIPVQTHQGLRY